MAQTGEYLVNKELIELFILNLTIIGLMDPLVTRIFGPPRKIDPPDSYIGKYLLNIDFHRMQAVFSVYILSFILLVSTVMFSIFKKAGNGFNANIMDTLILCALLFMSIIIYLLLVIMPIKYHERS